MFEKHRNARDFSKMMRICGGNIDNPSKADKIASTIILLPLRFEGDIWRSNKYVLTDAAFLTLILTLNTMPRISFDEMAKDIVRKTYSGISEFYRISIEEFALMQKNRFEIFNTDALISDTNAFIEEAQTLLKEDYANNRYFEYSLACPITLIGITEMFKVETEIKSYFGTIMPIILKILAEE